MPGLTVVYPRGAGATGQGEGGGRGQEEVKEEEEEGRPEERSRKQSSNQTPAVHQPQQTPWPQTLRTLLPLKGWYSFASVAAVWAVCQVEASLHPSALLVDVCWRLLLVGLLWTLVGACVHGLRRCLRPGQELGEPPIRIQQEVVTESKNNQYLWMSPPRAADHHDASLALVVANSLLLCVLHEPLSEPSVPHITTLLSKLELVSKSLEEADTGSEETLEDLDRDSTLRNKVNLLRSYLQQRMRSLSRLVHVQGDFEAGVKDMLQGLDGLWAQLEELHTGVTLTKEEGRGQGDLASAQTDAETLFTVLGHYKNRLQCCQVHLKDSTQLLQELTWSHTHLSNSVGSCSESVWTEMLLQSNMEQFDKVQEGFLSAEQQISTFRTHLEGLDEAIGRESPQTSPSLHSGRSGSVASLERRDSPSSSMSVSSADVDSDAEADAPLSLCERSALQLSSTMGRLRKSGRRK